MASTDGSSKVVWVADILPHEAAPAIDQMMTQGAKVMKQTLDRLSEETDGGR